MSGYVTYPFDTVRRRLQMQAEKPMNERIYNGALDCLRKIMAKEGMSFVSSQELLLCLKVLVPTFFVELELL